MFCLKIILQGSKCFSFQIIKCGVQSLPCDTSIMSDVDCHVSKGHEGFVRERTLPFSDGSRGRGGRRDEWASLSRAGPARPSTDVAAGKSTGPFSDVPPASLAVPHTSCKGCSRPPRGHVGPPAGLRDCAFLRARLGFLSHLLRCVCAGGLAEGIQNTSSHTI